MLGGWPRRGQRVAYLFAFVAITALTLGLLFNSEPYEFAKKYVASDAKVIQITGPQASVRVSWLRGFRYAFGDSTGEANFVFDVLGDRGRFEIRVFLEKRSGTWSVVRSQALSGSEPARDIVGTSAAPAGT
jgi:hypothetical protein